MTDSDAWSAAAAAGDLDVLRERLAAGADVNAGIIAPRGGVLDRLGLKRRGAGWLYRQLMQAVPTYLGQVDSHRFGLTPLHLAGIGGHEEAVVALLDAGADVDATDEQLGWTVLHWGAASSALRWSQEMHEAFDCADTTEHWRAAARVILKGADLKMVDLQGRTPLDVANRCNNGRMIEVFHKAGAAGEIGTATAMLDAQARKFFRAAEMGNVATLRRMIDGGVDVNVQDARGRTALFAAAGRGDEFASALLLDSGAHVNITDTAGETPLHEACRQGKRASVVMLLANDALIDAVNVRGRTPLWIALEASQPGIVEALLHSGADPNAETPDGRAPLDHARFHRDKAVARLLEHAGGQARQTAAEADARRLGCLPHAAGFMLLCVAAVRALL